jgi:hypothetical protein
MSGVSRVPTIENAPFVNFIVQNQLLPQYGKAYDESYNDAYRSNVSDINLEGIYDLFLQQIIAGTLTGDMAKVGKLVGSCLAKKIEEGKSPSCQLDNSDALGDPSLNLGMNLRTALRLGWLKATCWTSLIPPCEARKEVFQVAKKELIIARDTGLLEIAFKSAYPSVFRKTFLDTLNEQRSRIASLVTSKFGGVEQSEFWNQAPLFEANDLSSRKTSMHEIAAGLRVDIRGASLLARSNDASLKGLSAALFYASANRLLSLMGGTQAKWDGKSFVSVPSDQPGGRYDPKNPKAAPRFETERFGGMTAMKGADGTLVTSSLDLTGYDPTRISAPSALQIFPTQFMIGENGVPSLASSEDAVETLGDLADLMNSLVDFLALSGPNSVLAPHFADEGALERIVDPKDPALFPRQGRALAAGLIAAELKNLLAPQGHVELPKTSAQPSAPSDVDPAHTGFLGVKFYDRIGLGGRLDGQVPTDSLARLFFAAGRLSALMAAKDPDIPAELMALQSEVDMAIQVGLLTIANNAQGKDGGFSEVLGQNGEPSGRSLHNCVDALRAMSLGYQASRSAALRQAIHAGWSFMDRYFVNFGTASGQSTVPSAIEGTQAQASNETMWALMNLWNETLGSPIYADLMNPELDTDWANSHGWVQWQARFDLLHKELERRLAL